MTSSVVEPRIFKSWHLTFKQVGWCLISDTYDFNELLPLGYHHALTSMIYVLHEHRLPVGVRELSTEVIHMYDSYYHRILWIQLSSKFKQLLIIIYDQP